MCCTTGSKAQVTTIQEDWSSKGDKTSGRRDVSRIQRLITKDRKEVLITGLITSLITGLITGLITSLITSLITGLITSLITGLITGLITHTTPIIIVFTKTWYFITEFMFRGVVSIVLFFCLEFSSFRTWCWSTSRRRTME